MTTITLSGYPEAVLGRSSTTVSLPSGATAGDAVVAVAAQHPRLASALLREGFRPRRSTKVLFRTEVADPETPIRSGEAVTVLAVLPCDG